jgi:hypothetical protein
MPVFICAPETKEYKLQKHHHDVTHQTVASLSLQKHNSLVNLQQYAAIPEHASNHAAQSNAIQELLYTQLAVVHPHQSSTPSVPSKSKLNTHD